jgi:hypothetical protein
MNVSQFSVAQLERAVAIKKQIAALEDELAEILGGSTGGTTTTTTTGRRKMSPAARAKIAAAARARWARFHAKHGKPEPKPKKFTMSASARAKIAAAARARWAKIKAQK